MDNKVIHLEVKRELHGFCVLRKVSASLREPLEVDYQILRRFDHKIALQSFGFVKFVAILAILFLSAEFTMVQVFLVVHYVDFRLVRQAIFKRVFRKALRFGFEKQIMLFKGFVRFCVAEVRELQELPILWVVEVNGARKLYSCTSLSHVY